MNVARSFLSLLLNMMKIIQRSSDNGWRKNRIKLCIFNQIVPLQPYFHNELIRWRTLSSMLDTKFFLNTWELLKILYVIPVGMKNKEKYFSLKSWIHNWLRNNISTDLLNCHLPPAIYHRRLVQIVSLIILPTKIWFATQMQAEIFFTVFPYAKIVYWN